MTSPDETPDENSDENSGEVPEDFSASIPDDISGIENLMEEGGQQEPGDLGNRGSAPADPLEAALQEAAERTADLQRLQAEFLNYKRRVERDRELVRENAVFAVLAPLLEVLDNIDRAREAGELEGGFKGVAEQLTRIVGGLGLTRFGEPGDAFDPTFHEALSHVGTDPGVQVTTVKHIAKAGYQIGERVVRAAQVLVVDPEDAPASSPESGAENGPQGDPESSNP